MAGLALPGIATGIDTGTLVQQLMAINSRRLARYQVEKFGYDEENEALTTLKNTITAVKTSTTALADMDDLVVFSTSSSDTDILTVSATSDANPGSHTIEVNQLAAAETWIQETSTCNYKTDYVGEGTFTYSYNHQETSIETVEGETTLQDLVNKINDDPNNPGVSAGLLYQSGKYHLMLNGQESGEDFQISINDETTEVRATSTTGGSFTTEEDVNASLTTKITELVQFTPGEFIGNESISIAGINHFGTSIGSDTLAVNAETTVGHIIDAINEHFDGIATATFKNGEIYLTDHISDTSSLSITLGYNDDGGSTDLTLDTFDQSTAGGTDVGLTDFEKDDFIKTLSARDSQIKIDGYPASTTAEVQNLTTDAVAAESGSFTLSFRGKTTTSLAYDSTIQQIEDALNALDTITDVGGITLSGNNFTNAGGANMDITFLAAAGDVEMISIDKDTLDGPSTFTIAETAKGVDGWLHRNSNSINDAVSGISLNIKDITPVDDPVEITVTRNTSAISAKVQAMVSAFNGLKTMIEDYTEYNTDTKKMGLLSKNMIISLTKSQMIDPFYGLIDGFVSANDDLTQASDIGITVDGAGMLEFDNTIFAEAIDENYNNVLELLGATKDDSGNSDSDEISFYGASDRNTTAGTYLVQVDIDEFESNEIHAVRIKLSGESAWRETATWTGDGYITFDTDSFDPNTNAPLYLENSLQLTIDLNKTEADETYEATINVKQGIAGTLEDMFDEITEVGGRLDKSSDILDERITAMETKIVKEQARLETVQDRLTAKFARMEKLLTQLQQQMSSVSVLSAATFG
ncbi:flagellar filament capping protein FliD [Planctomycetota bacterium]